MSKEDEPKKVICPRPNCKGVVAHIYGDNMVSVKRSNNIIQNLGRDYNMVLTCPFKDCPTRTSIICSDGKIKEDNLKFLDEEEPNLDIKDHNNESGE